MSKIVKFVARGVDSITDVAARVTSTVKDSFYEIDGGMQEAYCRTQIALASDAGSPQNEQFFATELGEALDDVQQFYDRTAMGNFFDAIDDRENMPIVKHATTTTHPDTLLRKLGIIKQHGVFRGKEVYFNARFDEWRVTDTQQVIIEKKLPYGEKSIEGREDQVPKGVILVVGSISLPDPPKLGRTVRRVASTTTTTTTTSDPVSGKDSTQEQQTGGVKPLVPEDLGDTNAAGTSSNPNNTTTTSAWKKDNMQKELRRASAILDKGAARIQRAAAANNAEGEEEDGEDQPIGFTPEEQDRFIIQYLSRSIPYAAKEIGAMIVTMNSEDSITKHIGSGVVSYQKPRSGFQGEDPVITALSFKAFKEKEAAHIEKDLCPSFTHHAVLRRSTVARKVSASGGRCEGWLHHPNNPGRCATCRQLKLDHVPRFIFHSQLYKTKIKKEEQKKSEDDEKTEKKRKEALGEFDKFAPNGQMDADNFVKFMKEVMGTPLSETELKDLFKIAVGVNGTESIGSAALVAALPTIEHTEKAIAERKELEHQFSKYAVNGKMDSDNYVNFMNEVMGSQLPEEELEEDIFMAIDVEGTGSIGFTAFAAALPGVVQAESHYADPEKLDQAKKAIAAKVVAATAPLVSLKEKLQQSPVPLNEEEKKALEAQFANYAANGQMDATTVENFMKVVMGSELSDAQIRELFDSFDNGSGAVNVNTLSVIMPSLATAEKAMLADDKKIVEAAKKEIAKKVAQFIHFGDLAKKLVHVNNATPLTGPQKQALAEQLATYEQDGALDDKSFIKFMKEAMGSQLSEAELKDLFKALEIHGTGSIGFAALAAALPSIGQAEKAAVAQDAAAVVAAKKDITAKATAAQVDNEDDSESNPVSQDPLLREVNNYISRVIDCLALGYHPQLAYAGRTKFKPPERNSIPTCVVLVGGDLITTKYLLIQFIARRYNIIVIEGSGGYADLLCYTRRRIMAAFPDAGREEIQKYTTAMDPFTSEIIGNLELIKIVQAGTKIEEVGRLIEGSLKGDKALKNVWAAYAEWHDNAGKQKSLFLFYQAMLLVLSIVTTFITVFQTYLMLIWTAEGKDQPPTLPENANETWSESWLIFWTLMRWSVIVLPIGSSLVQAMSNRWNNGAKWVTLRTCSERLLSEIYAYRTSTGAYKPEEVEKHKDPHNAKDANFRIYNSKEDLLAQKKKELTDMLTTGATSSLALKSYSGPLPPKKIALIDDGFSALNPDEYIRVRANELLAKYNRKGLSANSRIAVIRFFIYFFSALGTGLAAVAAYAEGSVQAWVAFTTALVNALTRGIEHSRLEFLQKKYNSVIASLMCTTAWWASLGARADTKHNRDALVSQVEAASLDEVDAWAQQIHGAIEKLKVEGETKDDAEAGEKGGKKGGEGKSDVDSLREMGLEDLSADTLLAAVSDPIENDAAKCTSVVAEFTAKLGTDAPSAEEKEVEEIKKQAKSKAVDQAAHAQKLGECVSVLDSIKFGGHYVPSLLPSAVFTLYLDTQLRRGFIEKLLPGIRFGPTDDPSIRPQKSPQKNVDSDDDEDGTRKQLASAKNFNFLQVLEAMPEHPILLDVFKNLGQRGLLEVCKGFIVEELFSTFLDIETVDLKVRASHFFDSRKQYIESFISEWTSLARTPNIEKMRSSSILNLVQDRHIRAKLMSMGSFCSSPDGIVKELVKVAKSTLTPVHPLSVLFFQVLNLIASIDADEMMLNTQTAIHLSNSLVELETFQIKPRQLPKADLLALFPVALRPSLKHASQLQLARYLVNCLRGKTALRLVDSVMQKYGEIIPIKAVQAMSKKDFQIRIVAVVEDLLQREICALSKANLIKKMKAHPYFSVELESVLSLFSQDHLRMLLSVIQAKNNNTCAAQILDRVAVMVTSFDLRTVANYEIAERLVEKLLELRTVRSLSRRCKEDALMLLTFRKVIEAFDQLSEPQLHEMFERVQEETDLGWARMAAFRRTVKALPELFGVDGRAKSFCTSWSIKKVVRMFWLVNSFSEEELTQGDEGETVREGSNDPLQAEGGELEPGTPGQCAYLKTGRSNSVMLSSATTTTTATGPRINTRKGSNIHRILRIASDDAVIVSLQGFAKKDLDLFLTELKHQSQESELGTVFEAALQKTGADARIREDLMSIFGSIGARACVVQALACFFEEQYSELLSMENSNAFKKKCMKMFEEKKNKKQDVGGKGTNAIQATGTEATTTVTTTSPTATKSIVKPGSPILEGEVRSSLKPKEEAKDVTTKSSVQEKAKHEESVPSPALAPIGPSSGVPFRDVLAEPDAVTQSIVRNFLTELPAEVFHDFIYNIFAELKYSVPMRIFLEIARVTHWFDVRELFPSVEARYAFSIVLGICCMENPLPSAVADLQQGSSTSSPVMSMSISVGQGEPMVNFSRGLNSESDTSEAAVMKLDTKTNPYPPGEWKKKCMRALTSLDKKGFASIIPKFRVLSEAQLRFLCDRMRELLKTTIGQFFIRYIEFVNGDNSLDGLDPSNKIVEFAEECTLDASIYSLLQLAYQNPDKLDNALDKLDVDKFCKKDISEKAAALSKVMSVGTDMPRRLISNFPPPKYIPLFRMLQMAKDSSTSEEDRILAIKRETAQLLELMMSNAGGQLFSQDSQFSWMESKASN